MAKVFDLEKALGKWQENYFDKEKRQGLSGLVVDKATPWSLISGKGNRGSLFVGILPARGFCNLALVGMQCLHTQEITTIHPTTQK